jgi:ABC-type nitrate/sulfonate/bicarbonate transport system substrate-binding protein
MPETHSTRRFIAILASAGLAAVALAGCAGGDQPAASGEPGGAESCGTVSLGGLDDDTGRLAYYALDNDLIESDLIDDVEVNYLQIPALIQASQTGQFDYVMISLQGVVQARDAGLDKRVAAFAIGHTGAGLALYAQADSPVESGADVAGLTIATPSFGATATQEAQIVLAEEYGIDASLEGGEVTWTELDPPTMLNALEQGDIDLALLWNQGGWLASQNPDIKVVEQLDVAYEEMSGSWPIGSVIVADGEAIDASPECAAEFQRMLAESVAYAEENAADLAPEISEASGVPAEYIEFWWDPAHYQFGGVIDETWTGWAETFYELAAEHGLVAEVPDLSSFIVAS